jgi:hypothetical protein
VAKRWLEIEMDQTSRDVLGAADRWVTAVEAMTAASKEQRPDGTEQAELDAARVDLFSAVIVAAHRPPG